MYQATSLATLQARLADRYEGALFWTAEEARLAINEALRVWNLLIGFWKTRVELTTTAGMTWYIAPKPILYPLRMDFEGTPLVQTPIFDMDLGHPAWESETTATVGVPDRPTLWFPAGFALFAIWPTDAVGKGALVVDGVTVAPILIHPTDFVDLGDEETTILLGYALHVLAFKVGGPRFADTLPLYQKFLRAALLRNGRLASSKAFMKLLDKSTRRDSVPGPAAIVPTS